MVNRLSPCPGTIVGSWPDAVAMTVTVALEVSFLGLRYDERSCTKDNNGEKLTRRKKLNTCPKREGLDAMEEEDAKSGVL